MPNSMDNIIIQYGVRLNPIYAHSSEEDKKLHQQQLTQIKSCPLSEFIDPQKVPPETLSPSERTLQWSLIQLYRLNGPNSVLYRSFPNRKPKLTIDCCNSFVSDDSAAAYDPESNSISLAPNISSLTRVLAHELKHAEQSSDEVYQKVVKYKVSSAQEYHAIRYLEEVQAYTFEAYVAYLLAKLKDPQNWQQHMGTAAYDKILTPLLAQYDANHATVRSRSLWERLTGDPITDENLSQKMMEKLLPQLFRSNYRLVYQVVMPILKGEQGKLENIPDSFHIKPKEAASILKLLQKIPTETWVLNDENFNMCMVYDPARHKNITPRQAAKLAMPSLKMATMQISDETTCIKIGKQALKQFDSLGHFANGPFSRTSFFESFVKKYPDHPFITQILATHTKQGNSWVPLQTRCEYLRNYIASHDIPQIERQISQWRRSRHPAFLPEEIGHFLMQFQLDLDSFFPLSNNQLDTSHPILTDPQDLKNWYQQRAKVFHILTKNTPLSAKMVPNILASAALYGHTEVVSSILQHTDKNIPEISPHDIQLTFKAVSQHLYHIENQHPSQQEFIKQRLHQIITTFFDTKDKDGNSVISAANIETFTNELKTSDLGKALIPAVQQYRKLHPNDVRFQTKLQTKLAQNSEKKANASTSKLRASSQATVCK